MGHITWKEDSGVMTDLAQTADTFANKHLTSKMAEINVFHTSKEDLNSIFKQKQYSASL